MTDYNDGKWHGWNGGECPVHPKTVVDAVDHGDFKKFTNYTAGELNWNFCGGFRVHREHREPREFWIITYEGTAWDHEWQAKKRAAFSHSPIIHVREVQS